MWVDNLQAAVQMALLGRGIVALPHILAHTETGLVRALPEPVAFSDGDLVYHASLRGVVRVHTAVEALAQVMAAHAHEWTGLPTV